MVPPFFSELLKEAKGILFNGYNFGVLKLDGRAKSEDGMSFTSSAKSKQDDGFIFGDLRFSYEYKGIYFYEKWSTNNRYKTEATLKNVIADNIKNVLGGYFFTNSKEGRKAYSKNKFVFDPLALNLNIDTEGKLHVDASALVIDNLAIGGACDYNYNENEVQNYKVVARYQVNEDIILGLQYKKDNYYSGSVYYRTMPDLMTSVLVRGGGGGEEGGSGATTVGLGCKYKMDDVSSLMAKIISTKEFGIAYHHRIHNASIGISALFDCNDFQNGNHKAGLCLRVEV